MKYHSLRCIDNFTLGFQHLAITQFIGSVDNCPITFTFNRCDGCSNDNGYTTISIALTGIILLCQVDLRAIIRSRNSLSRNANRPTQHKQNQTQILHKTTFYSKTQIKYKMFDCLM